MRIDAEQRGNLRSDSAVVEFRDNHILRATVTGKPANFEQKRIGSEQMARGHADKILYDVNERHASASPRTPGSPTGKSEISGPVLVYNIRAQNVQAGYHARQRSSACTSSSSPAAAPGKDAGKTPDAGKPQPTPQS